VNFEYSTKFTHSKFKINSDIRKKIIFICKKLIILFCVKKLKVIGNLLILSYFCLIIHLDTKRYNENI